MSGHSDLIDALRDMQRQLPPGPQDPVTLVRKDNPLVRRSEAAIGVTAELIDELSKAHQIIRIALNTLPADAKARFFVSIQAADLDGEGITRANERERLLARVGGAS